MLDKKTNTLKILYRFLLQQSKEGVKELWGDLKAVRWIRFFGWFSFICWLGGLVVCLTLSSLFTPSDGGNTCAPDGSFDVGSKNYNNFNPASFFQITIGYGVLPFGTAKAIDIVWDIVYLSPKLLAIGHIN
jgi:hypothetical protein